MGDQVKAKLYVIKTVCGKCGLQFNETEPFIRDFQGPFISDARNALPTTSWSEPMSDPRAADLKKKITAWVKGKWYSISWESHPKADLAVDGLGGLLRYRSDSPEGEALIAIIHKAGACYDVEWSPANSDNLTALYFVPSNLTSTWWCVKLADGRYRDFFDKRTLEISRDAGVIGHEGKMVKVSLRPVKEGETSIYWAYWNTITGKYEFCHPGRAILGMVTDGDFKREERENKGRVVNVMIKEV